MAVTINGSTGIEYDDNVKHILGTGDDLEIYHDGSNSYIKDTGTGSLCILGSEIQLTNAGDSENLAVFKNDGAVELYHNGTKKLETTSGGAQVTGNMVADAFYLGDNEKLYCGTGDDLQIFHNGTDSIIDNNTGELKIETGIFNVRTDNGNENSIYCTYDAGVKLYYNGTEKFATENGGAKVSGDLTIRSGTSSQINFYDDSTHTITNYTSSVHLRWWDQPGSDVIMSLESDGDLKIDGSYSSGGVDYAEYFESTDGSAIAVGTTVVLDNGKVRAATGSETPIGVIRPKTSGTSVTGGRNEFNWQGKYLTDDYDGLLVENATFCTWEEGQEHKQCWKDRPPTGVTIPDDAVEITRSRKKLNPSYDASKTYVPRSERVEWNCVGLLGQIPITKGQPTSTNWIKMKERSSTVELWMVK